MGTTQKDVKKDPNATQKNQDLHWIKGSQGQTTDFVSEQKHKYILSAKKNKRKNKRDILEFTGTQSTTEEVTTENPTSTSTSSQNHSIQTWTPNQTTCSYVTSQ